MASSNPDPDQSPKKRLNVREETNPDQNPNKKSTVREDPNPDHKSTSTSRNANPKSPSTNQPPGSRSQRDSSQQGVKNQTPYQKRKRKGPPGFLVHKGKVMGLQRRKGEKNKLNYNLWLEKGAEKTPAAIKIGEFATGPLPPLGWKEPKKHKDEEDEEDEGKSDGKEKGKKCIVS